MIVKCIIKRKCTLRNNKETETKPKVIVVKNIGLLLLGKRRFSATLELCYGSMCCLVFEVKVPKHLTHSHQRHTATQ